MTDLDMMIKFLTERGFHLSVTTVMINRGTEKQFHLTIFANEKCHTYCQMIFSADKTIEEIIQPKN